MSANDFYQSVHGSHAFLSRATIVALMEQYEAHLKTQKPDDDSHLRADVHFEEKPKEGRFQVHFNNAF